MDERKGGDVGRGMREGMGNEGCGKGKWDGDWWKQGRGLKPREMEG